MTYLRKLFSLEQRIISTIYVAALVLDLYFIWSGAGYLLSILMVVIQGCTLTWFVTQAVGGADRANSLAYTMVLSTVVEKVKGLMGKGGNNSGLPI